MITAVREWLHRLHCDAIIIRAVWIALRRCEVYDPVERAVYVTAKATLFGTETLANRHEPATTHHI